MRRILLPVGLGVAVTLAAACANQSDSAVGSSAAGRPQGIGGAAASGAPLGLGGNGASGSSQGINMPSASVAGAKATTSGQTQVPACGDGLVNQTDEQCDDGNRNEGDGCSAACRIEAYYLCSTPGQPCVSTKVCGDGQLVGDEACDDGGVAAGDGCSATCTVESGFVCPLPGAPCLELCGDSLVVGREGCDDGNAASGDGCSKACQLENDVTVGANGRPSSWVCPIPGTPCTRAACGDGNKQGSEPCDDGNDRPADGCSPNCEIEPQCSGNGCVSRCGDGIILPGDQEDCDDGNRLNGDGCSADCLREAGYDCQPIASSLPDKLLIPVVFRDFVGAQRALAGAPIHPDFESTRGATSTQGLVAKNLSADGVPTLTGLCVGAPVNGILTGATNNACPRATVSGSSTIYGFNQMSSDAAFAQWYTDVPSVNRTIVSRLCLSRSGSTNKYVFDSETSNSTDCGPAKTCDSGSCRFLPINDQGFVAEGLEVDNLKKPDVLFGATDPASLKGNFDFTSVVRTWFVYGGNERLEFSGDDDVWVFINGRLAVDIGGLHSKVADGVTLDAAHASDLNLVAGRVYEIVLFHAERYGYGSNFKLTLTGFSTAKSQCLSRCGDGVRADREACDNGAANVASGSADAYGRCTDRCELGPRCGDGIVQPAGEEECDSPSTQTFYAAVPGTGCTPSCKLPGYCGDGVLQTGFEACDDGNKNSPDPAAYGKCLSNCSLGPRCGDGIKNGDEQCDEGADNGKTSCSIGCRLPILL